MRSDYYKPGSWNAICDSCGIKFKAEDLRLRWDGLRVCSKDFEFRNPQDFIRVPKEQITPPWSRPDAPTVEYVCNFITSQGIAGVGVADCARADYINP